MATQVTDKTTGVNAYAGILTRGVQAAIAAASVVDGKIRVATDSQQLYFDLGSGARIEITDVIKTYTSTEIESDDGTDIPVALRGKLFLASDTKHLYVHNGTTWIDLNASGGVASVTETGSGNAYTSMSTLNGVVTLTKGSTFLTAHPAITMGTDTTSTFTEDESHKTFTVVDSITKDTNGHVTAVNTKTVNLFDYDFGELVDPDPNE